MSARNSRITTVAVAMTVLLSLVVAATGGAAAEAQAPQGYEISIETPDGLAADDGQRIGVEINNTEGNSDLFSPIVEIPFPDGYNVSQEALDNAYIKYDNGTTEAVEDAEVLNSSFRSGEAIFLYGENIEQGDIETYYVNVSIDSPGSSTIEAETRLLYNENDDDVTARTSRTVDVSGFGNISASVTDSDGDASITINGTTVGSGSVNVERIEGTYEVGASDPDEPVSLPSFTQTVGVSEDESANYTVPQSLDNPTVIGTTQTASVDDASIGKTTSEPTSEQPKQVEVSYLLRTSGGTDVVAISKPDMGPIDSYSSSIDSGTISLTDHGETTNARIETNSDTSASVTYEGYKLGDTDKDGVIDETDAEAVAETVVDSGSSDEYYDADGDGEITATDAMYIAQHDAGNRGSYGSDS